MKIARTIRDYSPILAWSGVMSIVESARLMGPPSASREALTGICSGLIFLIWTLTDARRRRLAPCHDFGSLIAITSPASLVWYLLWSRGWRGLLVLLSLFGLMCVPSAVAWVVSLTHLARA